jgi:hypothetical protein
VLQAVVAKKYGGKVWNPRKGALQEPNEILDELLPKLEAFHSLEADRITKATENFINAQYTKTQKSLKDEGETMTLYRGTAQPKSRPGSDGNVDFDLDSLSSFTTDINIAKVYAYSVNGVVVEVQVPKKSVFGTWNSGFGEKVDFEVTVLGGSKRWKGRIV